jgi:DNA repair photolyase
VSPSPLIATPRGRGARSNASGRFEAQSVEAFDDGWGLDDPEPPRLDDELTALRQRTIISRNDSPDVSFEQSINPYIGCSHGCIYCYARPSHTYMGLSAGLDFESKIFFKPDAAELLEKALGKPGYACKPIHIGGNTDPYQPAERKLRITRALLEVARKWGQPISIITKSALITRDIDILSDMARRDLVHAAVSVTTLDRRLARVMEPRAATPSRRLESVRALAQSGTPTSVLFAPVIPGLNDHELEAVLAAAREAGAVQASYVVLRLPLEIRDLFVEWLKANVPDRAARVMSLVRQMRGGRDYQSDFGARMKGEGPVADLIRQRFAAAKRRLGLDGWPQPLSIAHFARPGSLGRQGDLFG